MASLKMWGAFVVTVLGFAALCQGQGQGCGTSQASIMSKMVTCATKNHPEYFLTVLTKMGNPTQMEDPDFMCSNQGMMNSLVECGLQYVEGCMPPAVESKVAPLLPSHSTIRRGVEFLCKHRKDFDHPCVKTSEMNLMMCFTNKLQSFSTAHLGYSGNMGEALCMALSTEEQCLTSVLTTCPKTVTDNLKEALLSFFPAESCGIKVPGSDRNLHFKPEVRHH